MTTRTPTPSIWTRLVIPHLFGTRSYQTHSPLLAGNGAAELDPMRLVYHHTAWRVKLGDTANERTDAGAGGRQKETAEL